MKFIPKAIKTDNRSNTEKGETASSVVSKGQGSKIKCWQAMPSYSSIRSPLCYSQSLLLEYGEILGKTLILNKHCTPHSKTMKKLSIFLKCNEHICLLQTNHRETIGEANRKA